MRALSKMKPHPHPPRGCTTLLDCGCTNHFQGLRFGDRTPDNHPAFVALLAVRNIAICVFKVHGSFSLVVTSGARHTVLMAYRSQADWDSVDWSGSDREIAAQLGVTHAAVSKRRKRMGHASDYRVGIALLRGWFEFNKSRLPRLTDYEIQVLVMDELDEIIEPGTVKYWRRQIRTATPSPYRISR